MPIDPKKLPKGRTAADATVDYVSAVMETVERGFERLTQQQAELNLSIIQLTGQVKELAKQQQRTADSLAEHLKLAQQQASTAEQQSATVAELTKLCTVLASKTS